MRFLIMFALFCGFVYADSKSDFEKCMKTPLVNQRTCFAVFRTAYADELHKACFQKRMGIDNIDTREGCKEYAFMFMHEFGATRNTDYDLTQDLLDGGNAIRQYLQYCKPQECYELAVAISHNVIDVSKRVKLPNTDFELMQLILFNRACKAKIQKACDSIGNNTF